MWEIWVLSLGWEDTLEKGMTSYSSILAWRIPRTIESIGSQRDGYDWATFTSLHMALDCTFTTRHIQTVHCFHFGSASSFLLELFLHSSPVAYWPPTDLGSSSFSVISLCLFILFIGFSRQECWSGLRFPSPLDHILSELFTMTCPTWVAQHCMAHSFNQLDKAVIHVISLVSLLYDLSYDLRYI